MAWQTGNRETTAKRRSQKPTRREGRAQRRSHNLHLFEARNNRPMAMLQRRRPKAVIALSTVIVGNANPPTTAPCVGTSMEPISSKSRKIWLDRARPFSSAPAWKRVRISVLMPYDETDPEPKRRL